MEKYNEQENPNARHEAVTTMAGSTSEHFVYNSSKANVKAQKSLSYITETSTARKVAAKWQKPRNISMASPVEGKGSIKGARKPLSRSSKTVLNIEKTKNQLSIQKSVQRNTKKMSNSNIRPVPDSVRIGIHSDSTETKTVESTKLSESSVSNECLTSEAVNLRNIYMKGIFEKVFDGLGSTTLDKVPSSQDKLNVEIDDAHVEISPRTVEQYSTLLENLESLEERRAANETTPVKRLPRPALPAAPNKNRDHASYHSSHGVARHVCEYCHKSFKSNGKLNSHVYSHTGERPYGCSHCGKAFSSKFKLVRHLLIHSEVRKFVCQICSRTFLRNDHLKNHYKIHDPLKKMFKCPKETCDKEYSSSMSYKKHMAVHSVEDGDLKCLICGVKYETKQEVLYHLKSHSGSRLFKSQNDKKFKCDHCDRLFLTRKDVTRHLVVHTGDRDFLCQFCPQRFGRKDHLVRHIRKSHHKPSKLSGKGAGGRAAQKEDKGRAVASIAEATGEERQARRATRAARGTAPDTTDGAEPSAATGAPAASDNSRACGPGPTHIVITVDGAKSTSHNRKRDAATSRKEKKKSFQKCESSVPNKKQVPFCKNKKSESRSCKKVTTQIFLQNIPNVFIIPSNSIILLRNQVVNKNVKTPDTADKEQNTQESEPAAAGVDPAGLGEGQDMLGGGLTEPLDLPFQPGFALDGNNPDMFHQSQFAPGFSDATNFTDIPDLNQSFDGCEPLTNSFDLISHLKRPENNDFHLLIDCDEVQGARRPETLTSKSVLSEASRQIRLLESGMNSAAATAPGRKVGVVRPVSKVCAGPAELPPELPPELPADARFEDPSDGLMLGESMLTDFKVDSPVLLDSDQEFHDGAFSKDGGVLNSMLTCCADHEGSELLRNLLTANPDAMSPLPGFSQIFHNSNANSG